MAWVEARDEHGKLWFRYDPARDLVEIGQRGVRRVFDLQALRDRREGAEMSEGRTEDGAVCKSNRPR